MNYGIGVLEDNPQFSISIAPAIDEIVGVQIISGPPRSIQFIAPYT
jgi:hypothetical protein